MQVTNDAWFGTASGPYQHFAQARVRAIEQGLPLARAANTGISAMVDPFGRVVASLGLARRGTSMLFFRRRCRPLRTSVSGTCPL